MSTANPLFADSLHDGELAMLEAADGVARLRGRTLNKNSWAIKIEGLKRLKAENVRQGSIILEAGIPGASMATTWLRWIDDLEDSAELLPYVERDLKAIAEGTLTLFTITPSHGVELAALGERIIVE